MDTHFCRFGILGSEMTLKKQCAKSKQEQGKISALFLLHLLLTDFVIMRLKKGGNQNDNRNECSKFLH